MAIFRRASGTLLVAALGLVITSAPASAGESAACNWSQANARSAQGDRYRMRQQFVAAAQSYIAASRSVQDCRAASGLMLSARSLAQGGAALAQGGDLFNARSTLESAQSRLQSMFAFDAQTATAARSYVNTIQGVIDAIDRLAQFSM